MPDKTRTEEAHVTGAELVEAIKTLVHQGNIRRISIRTSKGVTLLEIPLVVGLAGAVFVPLWAALGALAALLTKCTLVVERIEERPTRPRAPKHRATSRRRSSRRGTRTA